MIRAHVTDDSTGFGTRVTIVNQRDDEHEPGEILRLLGNENRAPDFKWEEHVPGSMFEPTLCAAHLGHVPHPAVLALA